jgi:hypothetical protein
MFIATKSGIGSLVIGRCYDSLSEDDNLNVSVTSQQHLLTITFKFDHSFSASIASIQDGIQAILSSDHISMSIHGNYMKVVGWDGKCYTRDLPFIYKEDKDNIVHAIVLDFGDPDLIPILDDLCEIVKWVSNILCDKEPINEII